jgi:hypothetical protein
VSGDTTKGPLDYQPPAIERRVPAEKPVIEGTAIYVGSGPAGPNPIWERDTDATGATP